MSDNSYNYNNNRNLGNSNNESHSSNTQSKSSSELQKCMLMNARSIVNKYSKLCALVRNENPALIGITETWLQPEMNFNLPGYLTFRCDRNSKGGGGLLCVKPCLKPTFIKEHKIGTSEILIVSILNNVGIILCYRPPNAPKADLVNMINFLETETAVFSKYILMGDFNLPQIDWGSYSTNDPSSKLFVDYCNDHSLTQFVDFATRSRNILDLVLSPTNDVLSVKSHPPLGASDHLIISFLLDETVPENFEPFYIYDYHKADYKLINAFLQTIDWDTFFYECVSTHDHWLRFSVLINYIHDEFIPMKLIRKHRNSKDHKWKKLYRLKCEKFKKFQSSNLERDRLNYLHAKQNCDGYVTNSRVEYENSLFYKRKKNSRSFYNYIKKHVSSDILVPTLDTPTGLAVRDAEKTETFSAQFKKAFVTDNNILPPVVPYDIKFPSSFEPVTPAEAIMAMKSINPNSSAGPHNISPKFFRNCAANFSRPISTMLNISFLEGVVLDEWKFANVTPIYKTGSKSNPINYRPISITSVFSKLAEFIIKDRILAHLDKNRLMKRSQHGFTAGRSVSTNLLECLDDWTDSFEKGLVTDILYFDFSKAFDSVVHSKLIHKLEINFY